MELREALAQISEIREQMARTEIFRGYHSVPVAITGVLAIAAACLQPMFIAYPAQQIARYLAFWAGMAAIGMTLSAVLKPKPISKHNLKNSPGASEILRRC